MILPLPAHEAGGTERIVVDLSHALDNLGHHVTVFAPTDSNLDLPCDGALPSLAWYQAGDTPVPPGLPGVLEAALLERLRERLDEFDIIHCHGEFFHAALLGTYRARSLTTIHWRTDELDRQLFFKAFPDLPVAAVSASQAEAIPETNQAAIVPHGLDPARFAAPSATPGAGNALLFIGRMTDQKRPDRAIEIAWRSQHALKLAGSVDPGNPYYFEHHVAPHLGKDIEYIGAIDDSAKRSLLAAAPALLFPIDWPEPFGLVLIEAMACGTPVIAWRNGAVPEIVEHGITGFIVDNMDDAVAAVAMLPKLDGEVIRRRFVERFSAARMARDYVEVYRRLLADADRREPVQTA
ncbi:glycosyl transferase [Salinisphaera dokdonensis CL-ES53]|uniref:Glycosyl transferase n=1 Tax=Salinisphaera dokdonensis CL-ES53 TaxID=1304272 RepID=A0ABV2B3F9_9GAMM